jgi:hypothetical protein
MNDKLNTIISKFGVPALTVAGAVIAILTGASSAVATLPLTIATNLLSNKLIDLTEIEISNRLKNIPPDKLNHDIFRVSKSAVKLALKATIDEYEIDNDTRKKLKKKVDKVCKQLENNAIWNEITVNDIIDYESSLSGNASKWSEVFSNELKASCNIFNDGKFDEKFQKHFHLYFGEYLKEDHAAFVAYEREMQKMIFNAIQELKGENISEIIKESIAQYIKEIPAVAVNSEMHKEIAKEFQAIRMHFESKEIITITKIDNKVHFEGYPPIERNYEQIQKFLDGKYQFRYKRDTVFYVDELNEQTFDYLAGEKVNHILISELWHSMKESNPKLQKLIEIDKDNWLTNDSLFSKCRVFITENLLGIIAANIANLYNIGESINNKVNDYNKYIAKCFLIVKNIVDLSVFICLSYLWEDETEIDGNTKKAIAGFLEMKKFKEEIPLLFQLLNIQDGKEHCILPELQKLKQERLSAWCDELSELSKTGDLDIFDCYRAEKILAEFLVNFSFLTNYNMISVNGMEYHSIRKTAPAYIQYRQPIDWSQEKINSKVFDTGTSTHAVLLVDKADENRFVNLYPFIIDCNALKNNKYLIPSIAFFNYYYENELDYEVLQCKRDEEGIKDKGKYTKLEFDGKIPDTDKYSDTNIEQHNINCVLKSFEEIKQILTEI